MKVNIFEGARRIALLTGALWAIGCFSYALISKPYVTLIYAVPALNSSPVLAEECPGESATEYVERTAPDGRNVNVKLCFLASPSDSGEMLVPYADAGNGKVWMAEKYSSKVSAYTEGVARLFQLTPQGIEAFQTKHWAALLERWEQAALALIVGLGIGWGFVAAVGWIVRGFLGIPRGQDTRPNHKQ